MSENEKLGTLKPSVMVSSDLMEGTVVSYEVGNESSNTFTGPYAGVVRVVPKNPLAGLEVAVFHRETT